MKSYHVRSVRTFLENGETAVKYNSNVKLTSDRNGVLVVRPEVGSAEGQNIINLKSINDLDVSKSSGRGLIISGEVLHGCFLEFDSSGDRDLCYSDLIALKRSISGSYSVFTERTDEASATQYFQFYGYLSQQQNMMQDFIRTATYQRAVLDNLEDFRDKVVLDVGAGSGILSFFACQAGAKKVYAVEASSMAAYAEVLVRNNSLNDIMTVLPGKIEEIEIPEQVDLIISEPMGYMLLNERMLETFLHAKKWLKPGGKMYPSRGDLHVAPFTDDTLYMEQFNKANFWYTSSFHGVNLTSLREAAVKEYFSQPVVDTFDLRICLANSCKHTIDFQTANEEDLHDIDIPLSFPLLKSGTIHGLAFWFDVAFLGSQQVVWLSTAPTEPLTHWYQVRCLLENPIFVRVGQVLTGRVGLKANSRQSYDVTIDVGVEGTSTRSSNTLDLKNPYFRYTGQAPQPPPGGNTTSPSEKLWTQDMTSSVTHSGTGGSVPSLGSFVDYNGLGNGGDDIVMDMGGAQRRPSGSQFSNQSQVILGGNAHFPVNNALMIGDYAAGGMLFPNAGMIPNVTAPSPSGFRKAGKCWVMKPRRRKVVGSESLGKVEEVPVTLATVEAEKARSLFAELKREEDAVSLRNQGSGFFWWILVGCVVSAVLNAVYVATLFENSLHFSHLSTMEREMSLKTEMGFYYKFYKKLTREKDAFWSVLESFRNDTGTEFPNVINAFQRFNLFPEVALGCLYWQVSDFATAWNVSTKNCYIVDISHDHDDNEEAGEETSLVTCSGIGEPMHFYVSVVWCLAGLTAAGIFALGSILSSSLCGGVFAVWSFFCNHTHSTRVGWTPTLRESFGYPIFLVYLLLLTLLMKARHQRMLLQPLLLVSLSITGTLFLLVWQFSQFAMAVCIWILFLLHSFGTLRPRDIYPFLISQAVSVGLTYLTMHGNVMILSGVLTASLLAMVSLGATLGPTLRKYLPPMSAAVAQMGFALINTVGFKIELGNYLGTSGRGDDSHVFNLLRAKIANYKDFDTLLYLGQPEFKQLPGATWNDLCSSLLIPVALGVAMHLVVFRWGKVKYAQLRARFENAQNDLKKQENDPEASKIPQDLFGDMEIVEPIKAFHICLALMFGVMAGAIMRLKLFFTPQLCLVASLITGTRFLPERIRSKRKGLLVALLFAMTFKGWDGIQQALKMTGEGWHTRGEKDMLQWIMKDTPKNASFAGDMVTMAGISLVAERLTANHPHFEDFALRRRTEAIYQAFSRRSEKLLHAALRNISADFLVLDAVQCLESRSVKGTLLSLWDQLEPELVGKRQPLCPALYDGKIGPGFSRVFLNDEYSILKVNNL